MRAWWVAILCVVCLGASTAHAFELVLGGQLRVGGASLSDDDTNADADIELGPAGIGQLFAVFMPVPEFGAGLYLDGVMSAHDIEDSDATAEGEAGAIGLKLRGELGGFGGSFMVGYTWGHLDFDIPFGGLILDADFEGSGVQIGVDAYYSYELIPGFALEAGPYFTFASFEADDPDENGDNNTEYVTFGFMLQGTYTLGL